MLRGKAAHRITRSPHERVVSITFTVFDQAILKFSIHFRADCDNGRINYCGKNPFTKHFSYVRAPEPR